MTTPRTDNEIKYGAAYAAGGFHMVGFDNERGMGDHCHIDDVERPYKYVSIEQLIEDFIAAVNAARSKK